MELDIHSISEMKPGKKWQKLFQLHWPAYKAWFLSKENSQSPDLKTCRDRLKKYMPKFYPTYMELCRLSGSDKVAHRFLTGYRPPSYISGCAQVVHEAEAQLVRNYDFDPDLSEGTLLLSNWNGRAVMGMGDCLCGIIDGMNSEGLVVSLTFGGRKVVGDGFGIPFILRYVLEFCDTLDQAEETLHRIPSHMSYNVMLMNDQGEHRLIQVAPDHSPIVTDLSASTNHQDKVDWPEHAAFTKTVERELYLHEMLSREERTADQLADEFLKAPLFNRKYSLGFGTIYTAVYRPLERAVVLRWPGVKLRQTFSEFQEGITSITYSETIPLSANSNIRDGQLEADYDAAVDSYWVDYGRSWLHKEPFASGDVDFETDDASSTGIVERIHELLDQIKSLANKEGSKPWKEIAQKWTYLAKKENGERDF